MKKIRNIFISITFLLIYFCMFGIFNQANFSEDSNAAPTSPGTYYNPFNYVTVVSDGQVLEKNTIINETTRSVMINGPVTINLNPFNSYYTELPEENEEYFIKNIRTFRVKKAKKVEDMTFKYNGITFYCSEGYTSVADNPEKYYTFYSNLESPSSGYRISTINTCAISVADDENDNSYFIVSVIDSYTLKANNLKEIDFKFKTTFSLLVEGELIVKLQRPVVEFAHSKNPFLKFESYKDYNIDTETYEYYDYDSLLQSEQIFNKIRLTFLNDKYEYTELNPLYFNINFNGFTYNFKFFTAKPILKRTIVTKDPITNTDIIEEVEEEYEELCLFVEYVDSITNKTIELATDYVIEYDEDDVPYFKFNQRVLSNEQFSIDFTYRGRYAIEFYDNTYLEDYTNPNYYNTSFYLKNTLLSENDTNSRFNDIYILAESIDDDNNPLEYIVDKSTQNQSVLVLIKNMFYEEKSAVKLEDVIDRIEFTITEFGNTGGNHPITTAYYPTTEENKFDTNIHKIYELLQINDEGDYYMYCNTDAIYSFEIFAKNPKLDEYGDEYFDKTTYQFTIVKNIKVSFKPDIEDDTIDSTHVASRPYTTETINYTNKIQNNDPIQFSVAYNGRIPVDENGYSVANKTLDITYSNKYIIRYGMQTVNISHYLNEDNTAITFTFLGVGDMTVYITRGSEELVYTFNSENRNNTITFTEYANYTITLVDSMGTTPNEPYNINFAKKLNTSAIILIVLSSIIVLAIVAFIVIVRGRIKTR